MSERYYRDVNSNKDIVKFELQLGAILLKLNEDDLNISNIDDNITKLQNDIKNNDKDIKSNYDICIADKNNSIEVDRKIYALNNNITNINSDIENINSNIIKHKYSIANIWFYNIDIVNNYIITSWRVTLFEYNIESNFITNSILEISCNILYKYDNYNDIGLLQHIYRLIDSNDNVVYTNNIIHTNSGDNLDNKISLNDSFSILFKNSYTDRLKIELQISKVYINNTKSVVFRILNPYDNNTLRIKHIKYLLL